MLWENIIDQEREFVFEAEQTVIIESYCDLFFRVKYIDTYCTMQLQIQLLLRRATKFFVHVHHNRNKRAFSIFLVLSITRDRDKRLHHAHAVILLSL